MIDEIMLICEHQKEPTKVLVASILRAVNAHAEDLQATWNIETAELLLKADLIRTAGALDEPDG